MAVPSWPAGVPAANVSEEATASASFSPPIVSETEGGPPIMRRRSGPRFTEFRWRSQPLEGAEWGILDQFLRVTLMGATLVFEVPVYRPDQGFVVRKCQIKDGAVLNDFSQVPLATVSFTLIVWNW